MQKQNYEVDILVNGHSAREYIKDGKIYIEGRKKQEYSLRIKNNGYKRILAVPTVDGLSVLNGKEASYNSPGYIVNGHDSVTIHGWRIDDDNVAKFYFSDPEESYSELKGAANNNGVIGVAVFREKDPVYYYSAASVTYTGPSGIINRVFNNKHLNASANFMAQDAERGGSVNSLYAASLGTGWGESKKSSVTTVSFQSEKSVDAMFTIYYNTKQQLVKMGIDFDEKPRYVTPSAFPGQYCEPPKK